MSDKYICGGPLWAIFVSFNPRCSVASQTQTTMSSPEGAATTRSSSEATAPTTQSPEFNAEKHLKGGTKDFRFVPIPKRLQYDSTRPFQFTTVLNITFGFASTFSEYSKCLRVRMFPDLLHTAVANLYYCQPLLRPCFRALFEFK